MGRIARSLLPQPTAPGSAAFIHGLENAGVTPALLAKAVRTDPDGRTITDLSQLARLIPGATDAMGAPFAAGAETGLGPFAAAGMGPGQPAMPFPLGGEPRQWQYRPGFNFPSPPDSDRGIDATMLRTLADSYDLLRQCIEVCKSEIAALEWDIVPREKNRGKREKILQSEHDEIERIKQFFEWPEAYLVQDGNGKWIRRGRTPWAQWISAQLEEYYVGDWMTTWPRFLRNGNPVGFERVDGSTIKPLVDTEGRQPPPPLPAWQQYLYGVPRASFTLEELLYRPRVPRNHTVYGFSHVEQMLLLINLALRFQMWNQQAYTDGALPLGLLAFPEGWSADQIKSIVDELNALTSGLSDERQKWRGVPFGTQWLPIKPFQWDASFASYLIEYTCSLFGLNAMRLGFMPGRSEGSNALGGSAFSENQQSAADSNELLPTAGWVKGLMNELLDRVLGRPDLEFTFVGLQDEDEKEKLEADQLALTSGQKSWDQVLQENGEDPVGVSEPFVVIGNVPWSVADIKAIQDPDTPRGQKAPALPIRENEDPGGDLLPPGGGSDGSGGAGQPALPAGGRRPPELPAGEDARGGGRGQGQPAAVPAGSEKTFDLSSGMQPHGLGGAQARTEELRRWKRKAVRDARAGRPPRRFASDVIPEAQKAAIAQRLEHADDVLDVRSVFDTEIRKSSGIDQEATVAGLCVRAADTGRVLMLQRSITDRKDPAAGKWEFPGGHLEPDESPLQGAVREWQEETGTTLPAGELAGSWRSGIYEGFVYVVPSETDVQVSTSPDERRVLNPDDPDGDDIEVVAWWPPSEARSMPALRPECKDSDWKLIGQAVPKARFKAASGDKPIRDARYLTVEEARRAGSRALRKPHPSAQNGAQDDERSFKDLSHDNASRKSRTARHEAEMAAGVALVLRRRARTARDASLKNARGRMALSAADHRDIAATLANGRQQAYLDGGSRLARRAGAAPLETVHPDDLAALNDAAWNWSRAVVDGYHDTLESALADEDATVAKILQAVERYAGWKSEQAAVSNATGGYNAGALAVANREGLQSVIWTTEGDDRVCEECDERDGQVYSIADATVMGDEGLHPGCFPAGTAVDGPEVLASMTRWYSGWLVDIDFVSGNHLSVTPNHPVLTPKGWVAAGLLNLGDEVVRERVADRVGGGDPAEDEQPALIEDVAAAVGVASSVVARAVPVASEDFHGDGTGSEVCVVRADRLLEDSVETASGEPPTEIERERRDTGLVLLPGRSHLGALLERVPPPARGGVSGPHLASAVVGGHARPLELLGLAPGASADAVALEHDADRAAVDADDARDDVLGLAGSVESDDSLVVDDRTRATLDRDAGSLDPSPHGVMGDAVAEADLAEALAREVALDHVVDARWRQFDGHVYNLETTEGWYSANGVIVHNCRCEWELDPETLGTAEVE